MRMCRNLCMLWHPFVGAARPFRLIPVITEAKLSAVAESTNLCRMKPIFKFVTAWVFLAFCCAPGVVQSQTPSPWQTHFAGRFYSADPQSLSTTLASLLKNTAPITFKERPVAIIAPHAAYSASGQVAAYAFDAVRGKGYKRVIILAPSHHHRFEGISVLDTAAFETPLGAVSVDESALKILFSDKELADDMASGKPRLLYSGPKAYENEHSLEVELPFIKTVLPEAKIVPVVVGLLRAQDYERVAAALNRLVDEDTLIVVSSDFTHYGKHYSYEPFPNDKDIARRIRDNDYGVLAAILERDFNGLWARKAETHINACGINPVSLLLKMLPDDVMGTLLKYDTSGRLSGDYSLSVSYAAIAFTRPPAAILPKLLSDGGRTGDSFPSGMTPLSLAEREVLLRLARRTLDIYIQTGRYPSVDTEKLAKFPRFLRKEGVFVTLYKKGVLRGCIGFVGAQAELYKSIMANTVSAATKDARFSPVTSGELSEIQIEISVLTEPKRIAGIDHYDVRQDGILIKKDGAHGVFLPGVAAQFGWDKALTLEKLCQKAGMPADAWRHVGMEFYTFDSFVFGEEKNGS